MPANTSPIYCNVPANIWGVLTTANTAKDGTGTVVTIFTAGSNGSRVEQVRWVAQGSNTASVGRLFINNGSTNTTAGNNSYLCSIALPTVVNTEIAALADQIMAMYPYPFPLALKAGFKLLATIGTTVAAGWAVTALGGDY
jgi:hypothetical protein